MNFKLFRQQTLINHLRTLFVEEEHLQLTLWQIVFPLNRFRVAMTFSDLLRAYFAFNLYVVRF